MLNERIVRAAYRTSGYSMSDGANHIGGLSSDLAEATRRTQALKTDKQSQAALKARTIKANLTKRLRRAPPVSLAGVTNGDRR